MPPARQRRNSDAASETESDVSSVISYEIEPGEEIQPHGGLSEYEHRTLLENCDMQNVHYNRQPTPLERKVVIRQIQLEKAGIKVALAEDDAARGRVRPPKKAEQIIQRRERKVEYYRHQLNDLQRQVVREENTAQGMRYLRVEREVLDSVYKVLANEREERRNRSHELGSAAQEAKQGDYMQSPETRHNFAQVMRPDAEEVNAPHHGQSAQSQQEQRWAIDPAVRTATRIQVLETEKKHKLPTISSVQNQTQVTDFLEKFRLLSATVESSFGTDKPSFDHWLSSFNIAIFFSNNAKCEVDTLLYGRKLPSRNDPQQETNNWSTGMDIEKLFSTLRKATESSSDNNLSSQDVGGIQTYLNLIEKASRAKVNVPPKINGANNTKTITENTIYWSQKVCLEGTGREDHDLFPHLVHERTNVEGDNRVPYNPSTPQVILEGELGRLWTEDADSAAISVANKPQVAERLRVIKLAFKKFVEQSWKAKEDIDQRLKKRLVQTFTHGNVSHSDELGPSVQTPRELLLWMSWLIQTIIEDSQRFNIYLTPGVTKVPNNTSTYRQPQVVPRVNDKNHDGKGIRGGAGASNAAIRQTTNPKHVQKDIPPDKQICKKCGRFSHVTTDHAEEDVLPELRKYINDTDMPFKDSPNGLRCFKDLKKTYIPRPLANKERGKRNKYSKNKPCKYEAEILHALITAHPSFSNSTSPLTFTVTVIAENGATRVVQAFGDPGAVKSSYISHQLADWILSNGGIRTPCERMVCGAIAQNKSMNDVVVGDSNCERTNKCLEVKLRLEPDKVVNKLKKTKEIVIEVAAINAIYDIIIGLPDFRREGLFTTLQPLLEGSPIQDGAVRSALDTRARKPAKCSLCSAGCSHPGGTPCEECVEASAHAAEPVAGKATKLHIPTLLADGGRYKIAPEDIPQKPLLYDPNKFPKEKVGSVTEEGWAGPEEIQLYQARFGDQIPTQVYGTPEQRSKIFEVIGEFRSVFAKKLGIEPALLDPAEFEIDEKSWRSNGKNKQAARPISMEKMAIARKKVDEMLEAKVIVATLEAEAWSQINLVKKPDGDYRVTMDFRNLNAIMKSFSWPIPNISHIIRRFGQRRPKFFAVMDLKEGYHQAPLSVACQLFTAFITAFGVFHYLRVPQGIKIAASYFQYVMATVVLAQFIYTCVESYIDDFSVDDEGKGFDKFIANLRGVLGSIQERRMTISPKKSIFGISEITFVGHTIDQHGTHFSREKLDRVVDIEPPVFGKGLKSFLGLTNWFSAHIERYAILAAPLQKLVHNYQQCKHKKIQWTEEAREAFYAVREAVNKCPKLYFLVDNPEAKVTLRTDASDYGIGAILFQTYKDENNIDTIWPIAFMSKALHGPQLNWSVYEKEAYAIIYACRKFHYFIGDRHFTIETDHKNLTYIRDSGSEKVIRWKYEMMEYDADVNHINGVDNPISDGFSRILTEGAKDYYKAYSAANGGVTAELTEETMNCLWEFSTADIEEQTLWFPTKIEELFHMDEANNNSGAICIEVLSNLHEEGLQPDKSPKGNADPILDTASSLQGTQKRSRRSRKRTAKRLKTSVANKDEHSAEQEISSIISSGIGRVEGVRNVPLPQAEDRLDPVASIPALNTLSKTVTATGETHATNIYVGAATAQDSEVTESIRTEPCLGTREVPLSEESTTLIAHAHGGLHGHGGLERTIKLLTNRGIAWKSMRRDIQQFIAQCPCCQKMSELRVPITVAPFVLNTNKPMQRIMIDTIGPLTLDGDNNAYIVNIIDCFSRWCELYPQKSTTADETVFAIIDWCGRFGFPSEILTDGGTQFCNDLMKELFDILGTLQIVCTPYSKEEQGMIERSNKEVGRHLRAMIFDNLDNMKWGKRDLPMVQRVLNASIKGPLGVSPADILFGGAVNLDSNIIADPIGVAAKVKEAKRARGRSDEARSDGFLDKRHIGIEGEPLSKLASEMLAKQKEIIALAQRTQHKTNEQNLQKRRAKHLHSPLSEFAKGSYVLEEFPSNPLRRGPKEGKLKPTLRGPLRVVGNAGSAYKLLNLITGKQHVSHISRIREFVYDKLRTNPRDVALRDDNEFVVEKILDHKLIRGGRKTRKNDMTFLVKWEGYDAKDNTWEPWKGVRLVDKLHDYLRLHKMASWIPKNLNDEFDGN